MNSATILETGGGGTTIFKIVFGTLGFMYVHFHNVRPLNATTASSMAGYQEMHCLDKAPECSLLAGFLEAITHHEYVDIYRKSNGSCALVYGLGVLMTWDSWRPLFCTLSLSLSSSLVWNIMELCTKESCYRHHNARAMLRN